MCQSHLWAWRGKSQREQQSTASNFLSWGRARKKRRKYIQGDVCSHKIQEALSNGITQTARSTSRISVFSGAVSYTTSLLTEQREIKAMIVRYFPLIIIKKQNPSFLKNQAEGQCNLRRGEKRKRNTKSSNWFLKWWTFTFDYLFTGSLISILSLR